MESVDSTSTAAQIFFSITDYSSVLFFVNTRLVQVPTPRSIQAPPSRLGFTRRLSLVLEVRRTSIQGRPSAQDFDFLGFPGSPKDVGRVTEVLYVRSPITHSKIWIIMAGIT